MIARLPTRLTKPHDGSAAPRALCHTVMRSGRCLHRGTHGTVKAGDRAVARGWIEEFYDDGTLGIAITDPPPASPDGEVRQVADADFEIADDDLAELHAAELRDALDHLLLMLSIRSTRDLDPRIRAGLRGDRAEAIARGIRVLGRVGRGPLG